LSRRAETDSPPFAFAPASNLTKAEWARYIGSDTSWQPSCRDRPSNWRTPDSASAIAYPTCCDKR
jgi:hypothetical protein